jgi:hypothetical protein
MLCKEEEMNLTVDHSFRYEERVNYHLRVWESNSDANPPIILISDCNEINGARINVQDRNSIIKHVVSTLGYQPEQTENYYQDNENNTHVTKHVFLQERRPRELTTREKDDLPSMEEIRRAEKTLREENQVVSTYQYETVSLTSVEDKIGGEILQPWDMNRLTFPR